MRYTVFSAVISRVWKFNKFIKLLFVLNHGICNEYLYGSQNSN
jgi:hypothetical protein